MKIVHILYELGSGGAERFVVDLANRQAGEGHDVTLCMIRPVVGNNDFSTRFMDKAVGFVSLGISSGFSFSKLRKVAACLSGLQPDVVHAHHNVLPYLALPVFSGKRPLMVHTVHSDAHRANANRIERLYCKYLYRRALVRPVTISAASDASFSEVYGIQAVCIPNGREEVAPGVHFAAVKAEVEAYGPAPVFVHTGRCHPVKNQQLLVASFNALRAEGANFSLLIIGSGYESELGRSLKEQACDRVFFLGEKDNVTDYLLCADAFCLTSSSEGLPISLLEALACGATPVCTPVGGIPDVVKEGRTGYLSDGTEGKDYLAALHRFLDHPLPRKALEQYFEENFSMKRCCSAYLNFYRGQLAKTK